jgi:tetrapyrrole methylase family protein/MazG family protein
VIVVVGLGPAGPDLVTVAALDAIARVPAARRYLRTARHPAAPVVEAATTFDDVYESAATLDDVYDTIVARLLAVASDGNGDVLYAVPGSPAVAERTVELLLERSGSDVTVDLVPALSFLDLAWTRLRIDPVAAGVRVVDGHRFAVEAAGERGPLLVAQCDSAHVLSEMKLAFEREQPAGAVVLQRLGLGVDERVFDVAWEDLDRAGVVEPDHLTSVWIPHAAAPVAAELAGFHDVVRRLRAECPWDRAQTHQTLVRYAIEETYEVVEAIASGDPALLEDELGDLLLQVFLHAAIAAEAGEFTLADVAHTITEKMVRRHPHVFGTVVVEDAAHVARNWDQIKAAEKSGAGGDDRAAGLLDGVPASLPALAYAAELGRKAAKVHFDWPDVAGVWAKVDEELAELRGEPSAAFEELGDVLFAVAQLARHLGVDAEGALRAAGAKFRRRFGEVERLAAERGVDLSSAGLDVLDTLWDEAKLRERA